MMRAARENGTKQDNIRDWLQLAERDPVLQLLTKVGNCSNYFNGITYCLELLITHNFFQMLGFYCPL
jgi:hypothetical protein